MLISRCDSSLVQVVTTLFQRCQKSKERAEDRGAWRISDKYGAFLLEEIRLREDNFEYDIAAANEVLQQEREEEKCASVGDLEE